MNGYYKAIRPDGSSFHDPAFRWLRRDGKPYVRAVTHPGASGNHSTATLGTDATHYLSVSTSPADCTGMRWPCRLLAVEPVGEVWTPHLGDLPNKRAALAWRVVGELPAHEAFGPNGEAVVALIDRASRLTRQEAEGLAAARVAAWVAATTGAWDAAWAAAWAAAAAARAAAWDAARVAARALVVRDLISPEQFDILYGPWASVIGDSS